LQAWAAKEVVDWKEGQDMWKVSQVLAHWKNTGDITKGGFRSPKTEVLENLHDEHNETLAFSWPRSKASDKYHEMERARKQLPTEEQSKIEHGMWSDTKLLVRPDVAVKIVVDYQLIKLSWPASSSSSSSSQYEYYKAAQCNIRIDIQGIQQMVELFLEADARLGAVFRDHFISSCLSMERLERAFGFPRGWDITKGDITQQEKTAVEKEDR
jgi:hypothetical protein